MKELFKSLCVLLYDPSLLLNSLWRNEVCDTIASIFNPRQKWLTDVIPQKWCDKDELLRIINFQILLHFVESENGLDQLDADWSSEIKNGYVTEEYVDGVKKTYGELKQIYEYIKSGRAELEEIYIKHLDAQSYSDAQCIEDLIDVNDTYALTKIAEHRGKLWT